MAEQKITEEELRGWEQFDFAFKSTKEGISRLVAAYRDQAAEIERLRHLVPWYDRRIERYRAEAVLLREEIKQLKARGVTEREIDEWGIGKPRLISPDEIKLRLRSRGLLIKDAPEPIEHWSDGGKRCDIEQPIGDDPLKL